MDEDLPDLSGLAAAAHALLVDTGGRLIPPDVSARAIRTACAEVIDIPPSLVASVFREIEAAARPVMVSAWGPGSEVLARGRFGATAKIAPAQEPRAALDSCRVGSRAVIAMETRDPWWARLLAEPKLSVIDDFLSRGGLKPRAFAVAPLWSEPSGADRTWWITDSAAAPHEIEARLAELGLSGRHAIATGGMRLFALDGYVQQDDSRLAEAPGRLSGVIGAVPLIES